LREQISALLATLNSNPNLREKFLRAADLDAAVEVAKEAGLDLRKEDLLKYQANQTLELSDEEMESMSGGFISIGNYTRPKGQVSWVITQTFQDGCQYGNK
jgi:predicted ribosomally synthesized peptide with nif11-like leader